MIGDQILIRFFVECVPGRDRIGQPDGGQLLGEPQGSDGVHVGLVAQRPLDRHLEAGSGRDRPAAVGRGLDQGGNRLFGLDPSGLGLVLLALGGGEDDGEVFDAFDVCCCHGVLLCGLNWCRPLTGSWVFCPGPLTRYPSLYRSQGRFVAAAWGACCCLAGAWGRAWVVCWAGAEVRAGAWSGACWAPSGALYAVTLLSGP